MPGILILPRQRPSPPAYNSGVLQRMTNFANALAALLARSHFVVHGDSMTPTLCDGDLVYAAPRRLTRRPLRRGDIVVAHGPTDAGAPGIIIKRISGLPGDWIECSPAGAVVAHPELPAAADSPAPTTVWPCAADEIFLTGDNRDESADSRKYGPLPETAIIGRVMLIAPTHRLRRNPGAKSAARP